MLIQQGTSSTPLLFLMVDSSDHLTAKTGLSPSVTLSKCGGGFSAPAGAVTEIGSGWYKVAGNAADTNTLGPLILHATATGADPVDSLWEVVAVNVQDAAALGLSRLDAAVTSRLASASYTAPDNAGVTAIKAKTDNLPASPAAVGSAMALTAAYDAAKTALSAAAYTTPPTAADIATAVWAAGTRTLSSFGSLVADAAAAVWAIAKSSLTGTGTIGRWLGTEMAATIGDAQTQTDMMAVVEKLDTTLEANGDVSRFTTGALAKAPTGNAPTAAQIDSQLSGTHGAGPWGATGSGDTPYTPPAITDVGGSPMADVRVTIFLYDSVQPIESRVTNSSGVVENPFMLNTGVKYVLRASKDGFNFDSLEVTL